jgi:hypothetical protein
MIDATPSRAHRTVRPAAPGPQIEIAGAAGPAVGQCRPGAGYNRGDQGGREGQGRTGEQGLDRQGQELAASLNTRLQHVLSNAIRDRGNDVHRRWQ